MFNQPTDRLTDTTDHLADLMDAARLAGDIDTYIDVQAQLADHLTSVRSASLRAGDVIRFTSLVNG